jgi:hypothetical protein
VLCYFPPYQVDELYSLDLDALNDLQYVILHLVITRMPF